jgi:hypothetical protein
MTPVTLRTAYGAKLRVERSSLRASNDASGPIVNLRSRFEHVQATRNQAGCLIRLGALSDDGVLVGFALTHSATDLSIGLFDIGEPLSQELTRVALQTGRVNVALHGGDDAVHIDTQLTSGARQVYEANQGRTPASAAQYNDVALAVIQRLCDTDGARDFLAYPESLRHVTVSLCVSR